MTLRAGDIIDQYEVVGTVGAGGMGLVYKVRHRISQRVEALKLIQSNLSDSANLSRRFMQEIRILAGLNHPNIAALHNAFESGGQLFMVMEYVEGITLSDLMKRERPSLSVATQYVAQTLAALEYAHSRRVVHRDVKPSNIMIAASGAKLMDFGIALSRAAADETTSGLAMGSVYYISPEQVRGAGADQRSDLYSMGVILYELLTNVRPFEGKTNYEVLNAQVKHNPPPPDSIDSTVARELSQVCLRAIAKSPDERFQSARDFREALAAAMPGLTIANTTDSTPSIAASQAEPGADWLSEAELEKVERLLVPIVGPLARFSVRRAYKESKNPSEFCQALGHLVPEGPEQQKIVSLCRQELGLSNPRKGTKANTPASATQRFDAQLLASTALRLAKFIGPVARVVVARTAERAQTLDQLYAELAKEIPSSQDRAEFLRASTA